MVLLVSVLIFLLFSIIPERFLFFVERAFWKHSTPLARRGKKRKERAETISLKFQVQMLGNNGIEFLLERVFWIIPRRTLHSFLSERPCTVHGLRF